MPKIAITGTIASGKSSVSIYLRSLGYTVFDCDEYNNQLLESNSKVFDLISNRFKDCIKDNRIDKKALANVIFNDKNAKKELESILHPLIKEEIIKQSNEGVIFFEVPLLFETDFYKLFETKWLVYSDFNTCIHRLTLKGYTKDEAISRLNNQMPIDQKIKLADEILYNNKDFNYLNKQVEELIKNVGK